jgi:hypothetical protein
VLRCREGRKSRAGAGDERQTEPAERQLRAEDRGEGANPVQRLRRQDYLHVPTTNAAKYTPWLWRSAQAWKGRTVFPNAEVQLRIVHMARASLNCVNWKQRKEVAADLKEISPQSSVLRLAAISRRRVKGSSARRSEASGSYQSESPASQCASGDHGAPHHFRRCPGA